MKKLTTQEWIQKAKSVHGNKYSYKKSLYTISLAKIIITCKKHGDFQQTANSHLNGRGCIKCRGEATSKLHRSNTSEFIDKCIKIYGSKYDYFKVKYKSAIQRVEIKCETHGSFEVTPNDHLSGQGCPKCSHVNKIQKLSKSTDTFIKEAKSIHKDAYDYTITEYKNSYTSLSIICKLHGDFVINPRYHLKGQGCPKCKSTRASQIAIRWIEEVAKQKRFKNVKHLKNGGEYTIPGTKYRVDGYHEPTKTVFEFHGDRWHGNPKIYKPNDKCHPFLDKKAKELYKETINREKIIKQLGYKLIVMWESDYRKLKRI